MKNVLHPQRKEFSVGRLRRWLLGISTEEAGFARRGFLLTEEKTYRRLEQIGRTFLYGYHIALEEGEPEATALRLSEVEVDDRGFAFEGAAMGLTLLDQLTPWKTTRLRDFVGGPGSRHAYMIYVGAGWAFARLSRSRIQKVLKSFDPLLRWLVWDGYGFHEGYFHWPLYLSGRKTAAGLKGYARRAFTQGLGRSLWFVRGADVGQIATTVAALPATGHGDLWSGVGLACAYAGGASRASIETLRATAGPHRIALAQGAAFAAKTRQRAGNPASHTEIACRVLCGLSSDEVALLTDAALRGLPDDGAIPAYETWRQRIQAAFAREVTGV
jgi:hypothetical protein